MVAQGHTQNVGAASPPHHCGKQLGSRHEQVNAQIFIKLRQSDRRHGRGPTPVVHDRVHEVAGRAHSTGTHFTSQRHIGGLMSLGGKQCVYGGVIALPLPRDCFVKRRREVARWVLEALAKNRVQRESRQSKVERLDDPSLAQENRCGASTGDRRPRWHFEALSRCYSHAKGCVPNSQQGTRSTGRPLQQKCIQIRPHRRSTASTAATQSRQSGRLAVEHRRSEVIPASAVTSCPAEQHAAWM
mmetsp:Transcript_50731/g.135260  ORF Transcript_50731/g.135260 Transcript_50731/m.135260 type:complete len:243 (+) Transcript_50731:386-1114(+)